MASPAERLRRMDTLLNLIRLANPANEKKLIAEFCMKTGVLPRTVKEYIQLMIDSGRVSRVDGELRFNNG